MEDNKNLATDAKTAAEEDSKSFNFEAIYRTFILNWKWFVLFVILCLGLAAIYLRYTTPIYQASAKLLIKDNDQRSSRNMMYSTSLGTLSNSQGIENEMEILKSHSIAEQAVRDLKLYVNYYSVGKVADRLMYKTQPITVDVDPAHIETLVAPISLQIERTNGKYHVTGTYTVAAGEKGQGGGTFSIDKTLTTLPSTIGTRAGIITFYSNSFTPMAEGTIMKATIMSPKAAANKYVGSFSVAAGGEGTSIIQLVLNDEIPQRAVDYLQQLAVCYNRQANEDKNEVARRTEEFINGRLEKINAELGSTEGALESYKRSNRMIDQKTNATTAFGNADTYSQKIADANTQIALLNELESYMNSSKGRYQSIPSNVGVADETATALIGNYNQIVAQRNRLLQSASENSPSVLPLTAQLDDLEKSIRQAMTQSRKNMEIQRNSLSSQLGKYQGEVSESPEQERILTQIGRQQEVKSGLYLMLLQKREENSISLAATADKGKLLDTPSVNGKVSPKNNMILAIALLAGIGVPALVLFLLQLFRYKIEGHDDVEKLTKLPIIADVAVASDEAMTKANIVVHENQNNMMEEIYRTMRTNLLFMLEGDQKVIMFTSSTSGEGKTFNAANLAISFALLGKKVLLVGLDIRKPRLAQLFEIDDYQHGITNLLVKNELTWHDISEQIVSSGVNNNLDLLMSGPVPPNPTELVARKSLESIFEILRATYDYIIVDTAPVGLVTDTLQISRVADATVYVCRADYTPKEYIALVNDLAENKKLPKVSIVINGIDLSKRKYGYYYGYGNYGKFGRYGKYGSNYKPYGSYGTYGTYGSYSQSAYGDKNDNSVKRK